MQSGEIKKKKRKTTAALLSVPKTVLPRQRVREFAGESLIVSNGVLFCDACKTVLSVKMSSIKTHILTVKHGKNKEVLRNNVIRQENIATWLQANPVYHEGSHLPDVHKVFRVRTIQTFLGAGVPISRIPLFREFLEEFSHFSLTDMEHMRKLLPTILAIEKQRIKGSLAGVQISLAFDGATRLGEVINIVGRTIVNTRAGWKIVHQLLRLHHRDVSVNHVVLARVLNQCLFDYGISPLSILAVSCDEASVNIAALNVVSILWQNTIRITCWAHMIDRLGEKFDCAHADEFMDLWRGMFGRSPKACLAWKTLNGVNIKKHSKTRWWSWWECVRQVGTSWPDVEHFFEPGFTNACPNTIHRGQHLLDQINNLQNYCRIRVEIAVYMDIGLKLTQTTYWIEGNGALIFSVYDKLKELKFFLHDPPIPITTAVINKMASQMPPNEVVRFGQEWMNFARDRFKDVQSYWLRKWAQRKSNLKVFKLARFFHPGRVQDLTFLAAHVQDFVNILPWVTNVDVNSLLLELPLYLTIVQGTASDVDVLSWWSRHATEIPAFAKLAKDLLLIVPSSAESERIFSLMKNYLSKKQLSALEETMEVTLMLRYNKQHS